MAKAKRVFQVAKELGVTSKDILRKCEAEEVPNITNHMSTVAVGLEETLHQWFGETGEGHAATAVETAPKVQVQRKARKKAAPKKAKAVEKPEVVEADAAAAVDGKEVADADAAAAATPVEEPQVTEVAAETPAANDTVLPITVIAPETSAPTEDGQEQPVEVIEPAESALAPAAEATDSEAPATADENETADQAVTTPGEAVMNVPRRPKEIGPAGPQLEETKPAKLSGPRIVRIEQPDAVVRPTPRRSAPSHGDSPGGAPASDAARGRGAAPPRHSRTKRRGATTPDHGDSRRTRGVGQGKWRAQDLREREARLTGAGGFFKKRRREAKRQEGAADRPLTAAQTGGEVHIQAPFTIKDLSAATGVKSADIIKKLFMQGVMTNVNAGIDVETAQDVMIEWDIELLAEERKTASEQVAEEFEQRDIVDRGPCPPVVTILGHVDHGKTSLLDRIRETNVAEGEAGGITQATSAFRVPVKAGNAEKMITFLDTPGHEAFTAMRARGAQMTDLVILVVAADDGVMPQTIESINHTKAGNVPIVVALNKIDKPEATDANIQRILGQLAEHGLNPSEWGGDTEIIKTSAIKNTGIQELLDTIDLQAEVMELHADFGGPARGTVIESQYEEGRGATANILVQDGWLKVGDFIVAGRGFGRVRDVTDDRGKRTDEAGPASPVQVSGLDVLPDAGDKFYVVDSLKKAQQAASQRRAQERELELSRPKITLDNLFTQLKEGEVKEMLVVVKADVQGSVDVVRDTVEKISGDQIRVRVLHAAVGGINESDVILAEASQAIILGFNVIASSSARQLAEQKGVEIRNYQVIYDLEEDVRKAAEGLLDPELRQDVVGHAEVRQVFKISKVGAIAGCYVTDGSIELNAFIRVTRDDIVIENDRKLEQLKRFKDDAKEVRSGQECGMKIASYDDIKEGDVLECYRTVEVRRKLE